MKNALAIQWDQTFFSPDEFPPYELEYTSAELILELNRFRRHLDSPIYPSPVSGALARNSGKSPNSRHYAVDRLSDAIDWFTDANPISTWWELIRWPAFGGVGIYFDTKYRNQPHPMFHVDQRPDKVAWLRYSENGKRKYVTYTAARPRLFLKELARHFKLTD